MAGFIVKQSAGSAPNIEDGLVDARFDGIRETDHPDWAGKLNKFNKVDTGERWSFDFTILDSDGNVVYDDRPDREGDPLEINKEVNRTVGEKSAAYAMLKGILTSGERAMLDAGEEFDLEGSFGRIVQLQIVHSDKGWPQIEMVIPGDKKLLAKLKAAQK